MPHSTQQKGRTRSREASRKQNPPQIRRKPSKPPQRTTNSNNTHVPYVTNNQRFYETQNYALQVTPFQAQPQSNYFPSYSQMQYVNQHHQNIQNPKDSYYYVNQSNAYMNNANHNYDSVLNGNLPPQSTPTANSNATVEMEIHMVTTPKSMNNNNLLYETKAEVSMKGQSYTVTYPSKNLNDFFKQLSENLGAFF